MDNLTQALTTLQQLQNEGIDLAQLFTAAQPLMDIGKTPLGLNQWKLSDKPRMEEFNEDNRIVDETLQELQNNRVLTNGQTQMTGDLHTTGINIHHGNIENFPWASVNFYSEGKPAAALISDKNGSVLLRVFNPTNKNEYKELGLTWNGNITWNGRKVLTE